MEIRACEKSVGVKSAFLAHSSNVVVRRKGGKSKNAGEIAEMVDFDAFQDGPLAPPCREACKTKIRDRIAVERLVAAARRRKP